MGKEDRRESFLINLGRATRRGVRQCRKCGTLNGTRGYSCKNKSCDVVFKEAGEKNKLSTEACKINTGNEYQIYSVRVRDKGPDYRGFVQFDNIQTVTTTTGCTSSNNSTFSSNPFDNNDHLHTVSFSNAGGGGSTSSIIAQLDHGGSQHFSTNQFDGMGELGDAMLLAATSDHSSNSTNSIITPPSAHCYVESCQKFKTSAQNKSGTNYICSHIKAVSQCYKNSTSIMLKSSVLNSMPLHPSMKNEIWQLATATPGPLVQRVSKTIMVVKCQTDTYHPLGFLHFSFQSSRYSSKDSNECGKYFCSCRSFKTSNSVIKAIPSLLSDNSGNRESRTHHMGMRSCVHMYACIVALASHSNLAAEFAQYISLVVGDPHKKISRDILSSMKEISGTVKIQVTEDDGDEDGSTAYIRVSETGSCIEDEDGSREQSFLILNDGSDPNCQVEVEVLPGDSADSFLQALDSADHNNERNNHRSCLDDTDATGVVSGSIEDKLEIKLHTAEEMGVELCTSDGNSISVHPCDASQITSTSCTSAALGSPQSIISCVSAAVSSANNHINNRSASHLDRQRDRASVVATSALLTLHNDKKGNCPISRRGPYSYHNRKHRDSLSESNCAMSFHEWLSMVTERINHSFQYAMPGKPAPLVFYIPKKYFEGILQRVHQIGRKKISIVQTVVPHPDPSLPDNKLMKHSFSIFNLSHLKTIFNNPFVTLQTTRSFLMNRNGTYQAFQPPESPQVSRGGGGSSMQQPLLIRPHEFRTVLKVGNSACQPVSKASAFIIEWTPNVLPLSKMGEFKLKFDFEHIHNGQLVKSFSFRDVIPAAATSSTNVNNGNDSNNASIGISVLQSPIILGNTPITSSSPTSLTSSCNQSNNVKVSTSKAVPTPIAPKLVLPVQNKEPLEDNCTRNVLGISLAQDTYVDSDGYATLFI